MRDNTLHALIFGFAGLCLFAGCGGPPAKAPDSWETFRAGVYQEPETGVFIVNGDEAIDDEAKLRRFYKRMVASQTEGEHVIAGLSELKSPLLVSRVGSYDNAWNDCRAIALTYCVDTVSFGSRYASVVSAIDAAAKDWEAIAKVRFIHDATKDAACGRRNVSVVFNVRQVSGAPYFARSFFPDSGYANTEILVDGTAFSMGGPVTLTGVLRHELGHTLGFRHEHARPEVGKCLESSDWRALTPYDSKSVMHYPDCNGTNTGDLLLTALDKTGAATIYPETPKIYPRLETTPVPDMGTGIFYWQNDLRFYSDPTYTTPAALTAATTFKYALITYNWDYSSSSTYTMDWVNRSVTAAAGKTEFDMGPLAYTVCEEDGFGGMKGTCFAESCLLVAGTGYSIGCF